MAFKQVIYTPRCNRPLDSDVLQVVISEDGETLAAILRAPRSQVTDMPSNERSEVSCCDLELRVAVKRRGTSDAILENGVVGKPDIEGALGVLNSQVRRERDSRGDH